MKRWTVTADKFLDEAQTIRLVSYLRDQRDLALARDIQGPVRDHALILGLLYSGCRVSEACRLTVGDLKPRSLTVRCGKGGKDRTILLTLDAQRHFKEWLRTRRQLGLDDTPESFLFVSRYGKCYTSRAVQKRVASIFKCLGFTGTPHTLRHTNCTLLLQNAVPVAVVRDNLGHASLSTTSLYSHATGNLDGYSLIKSRR